MVPIWIQVHPGVIAAKPPPSASFMTAATTPPSVSIVTTTSASATASNGVFAATAPAATTAAARSRVRFQAWTANPAASSLWAIASPIRPVPRTATVFGMTSLKRNPPADQARATITRSAPTAGRTTDLRLDRKSQSFARHDG
jgi:hypothetical protein